MKYLCLVYLDEKRLDELPDEECVAYDTAIRKSGHCVGSEALRIRPDRHHGAREERQDIRHRRPVRRDQGAARRLLSCRGPRPGRSDPARLANPAGPRGQHRGTADPADPGDGGAGPRAKADAPDGKERMMATRTRKPVVRKQSPAARARPASRRVLVLVATRKGAWLFHGDAARKTWRVDGPHFLGHIVNHLVLDPRDGRTLLAAAKTGHLGPTVFRSTDLGRTWKEAARPPAFPKAPEGEKGRAVDHTFWLTPGHASEPDVWYAGHLAAGPVPLRGRRRHLGAVLLASTTIRSTATWMGSEQDGTPDGPKLHSIIVDPRDPAHLYFGMSSGGVHESRRRRPDLGAASRGSRWSRASTRAEPHLPRPALRAALPEQPGPPLPAEPLRHLPARPAVATRGCASARACRRRSATSASRWCVHPRDADTAWVFPMDGTRSGRAPARTASPRPTSRATAARPGSASTPACPQSRPGGR